MSIERTLVCDVCSRIVHSEATVSRVRTVAKRDNLYRVRVGPDGKKHDICTVCIPLPGQRFAYRIDFNRLRSFPSKVDGPASS